jgi:hypothetical protein
MVIPHPPDSESPGFNTGFIDKAQIGRVSFHLVRRRIERPISFIALAPIRVE